ncbi:MULTISPECIES: hypothetical protein [Streptomyces]|uniref:hypothetical protein n=1 Tax=Streptomyces TaxID=1883 RepID=UPI0013E029DB|nr:MULTISPECIES: hypothetical protein [Streptomyces]NYV74485.1 hypothetical protein [Streptomyces sp. UH6]
MLAIAGAVLFVLAFLINVTELDTNAVFSSGNLTLLGLAAVALHLAGLGGRRTRH